MLDILISLIGAVLLLVPMIIISSVIFFDDPGPVFFKQKRVGKKKNGKITYFNLIKFRSMKTCTPKNTPTHLLDDPEQYLTRVGKFIRKYSLDELPQIYHCLTQKMSIIGPRPALWNQYDLIAERDKSGSNNIRPGITGWAQINGRDELEIPEKAKLDGEYAAALEKGGITAFKMDLQCFFGTVKSVLKHEGNVEGGTGKMKNPRQ